MTNWAEYFCWRDRPQSSVTLISAKELWASSRPQQQSLNPSYQSAKNSPLSKLGSKQKNKTKQTNKKKFVLALPEQMLRLSLKPAKPTFPFLPKRTLHIHCKLTKKISCDREKRQIHHTYSLDLLILHY